MILMKHMHYCLALVMYKCNLIYIPKKLKNKIKKQEAHNKIILFIITFTPITSFFKKKKKKLTNHFNKVTSSPLNFNKETLKAN